MNAPLTLQSLTARHPEWTPWLALLHEVERATSDERWNACVPSATAPHDGMPRLARGRVQPDAALVGELWAALARAVGGDALTSAACAMRVFDAAVNADDATLAIIAREAGADARAVHARATLLPVPFLHACRRHWTDTPSAWRRGYCPTCGAWPAFLEICGIERTRYLRCGRCGCAWETLALACPYCATTDHDALGALVPQDEASVAIEVCSRCRGYVKAFTRLRPVAADAVMLHDLTSVELDIAAAERGYARPAGIGCALAVHTEEPA
jgi:FdhE protein